MLKRKAPFIFFGILVVFFIIREQIIKSKLDTDVRYTIGVIKEISFPVEGGLTAEYEFEVNHKKYSGLFSITTNQSKVCVNDSFLVKFNLHSPSISYPMFEKKITNTLDAPDSGWAHIPLVN